MRTTDEVLEGELVEADGVDIRLNVWKSIDKDRKAEFRRLMTEDGVTIAVAARKARISEQVIRNMISWGRNDPKSPAAQLARDVDEAMAAKEHEALGWLRDMAEKKTNHKAIEAWLEKLDPERYGPKPNVSATQVNVNFGDVMARLEESHVPGD